MGFYNIKQILTNRSIIAIVNKKICTMKKKISPIPPLPKGFVLTDELEKDLRAWIAVLLAISPRIKIKSVFDSDFDPDIYQDFFKREFGWSDDITEIEILNWPKRDEIAFVLMIDSSLPGKKPGFPVEYGCIFCYGDFAFRANNFEQNAEELCSKGKLICYSFNNYDIEAKLCTWEWQVKIVKMNLENILKKSIPPLPKSK